MITEGSRPEDVAPLLINTEPGKWNLHNDKELLNQKTVLNLDNAHVRLTLWCVVYMVLTSTQMANNLYEHLWWDELSDNWDYTQIEDEMNYFSLGISTNSILGCAVLILLCSWYCVCCNMNCNYCGAFLFIVGSVMQFATMIYGTQKDCKDILTGVDLNICRSLYVGSSVFLATFSFYLAVDIVKSTGNDIRVRIFVPSLLIAIRSYLLFAYFNYALNNSGDDWWDVSVADEFLLRTLSGSNLSCGIICSIILVIVTLGYGSGNKKIHPCIVRVLSYFLFGAIGSTMMIGMLSGTHLYQMSLFYAVAGVLLVYDLQYL